MGLKLDTLACKGQGPCGYAWAGFTASQPSEGTAQDILAWEFTLSTPAQIQQTIQPGGMPTTFGFGVHQTTVTYPPGFQNQNGILMTVTATPANGSDFYRQRLAGTAFSNELCIIYLGVGPYPGNCVVYTYTCQDTHGNPVMCPSEPECTSPQQSQCINVDTGYSTVQNVTATNADYLENDASGDNNWMSIFLSFMDKPIDSTTSGGTKGFGGSHSSPVLFTQPGIKVGSVGSADVVATFKPRQP
jgi:hypothetical protein